MLAAAESLRARGRLDDARAAVMHVLDIDGSNVRAHKGLGKILFELGNYGGARGEFEIAASSDPADAEAPFLLGNVARELGELQGAAVQYRRALALRPDYAEARNNEGVVYQEQGDLEKAAESYSNAVAIDPALVNAQFNLGLIRTEQGRLDDAVECFNSILARNDGLTEVHSAKGRVHFLRGEWTAAIESYRCAIAVDPKNVDAQNNLGNALAQMGRIDDCMIALRNAVSLQPGNALARSNLLFRLLHQSGATREEIFAEHLKFGERTADPPSTRSAHPDASDPERVLRVGFVSADLRAHAVANFIEPLWRALDPMKVQIWAYSSTPAEDAKTMELRALTHHWRNVFRMSDDALAQQIMDDHVDILVDLAGHTANNRLPVFARKPAPIQVSCIGNPSTTGLQTIDYYIVDRSSGPPELLDAWFTEKLVRIPWGPLFQPFPDAPPVNPSPFLATGLFTFGSFNRMDKLTPPVIALWSDVLNSVPHSVILLCGIDSADRRAELLTEFSAHGIGTERLRLHGRVPVNSYLALHHQVDMMLDTFPYTGLTVTCHAAWMGVPVLTLAGNTLSSRNGLMINTNLGLEEFVVDSKAEFVRRARSWSQRPGELADLRAGMRARVENSPLRDVRTSACAFEAALRTMWKKWCAGAPAARFEIP